MFERQEGRKREKGSGREGGRVEGREEGGGMAEGREGEGEGEGEERACRPWKQLTNQRPRNSHRHRTTLGQFSSIVGQVHPVA